MNTRKKILSFSPLVMLFIMLLLPLLITAQDDSLKNNYQEEFDNFKQSIQNDFETFTSKNDSIFYQFLLQNWKEFELFKDQRKTIPKPKIQPRIDTTRTKTRYREIKPLEKRKTMLKDTGRQIQHQLTPNQYNALLFAKRPFKLDFYGNTILVPGVKTGPYLLDGQINKTQIAMFFRDNSSDKVLEEAIYSLLKQASEKGYNSWGYIRLVQEASKHYYENLNERVLFTWLALLKTGYDAKVGYNKQNIFLLVNFDVRAFYLSYMVNDGKKYYIVPFPEQTGKQQSIVTFTAAYPVDLQPVSLVIYKNPSFPEETKEKFINYKSERIRLTYNQNMVDFYNSYPDCELPVYFPPPPSETVFKSLEVYFKPLFKEKTPTEKVAILLDFVQMVLPYKTDEDQFGKEKYMFAEETLAANYSDCEDRAILLGQLISHFTGLNSIGLVFPGHVSLAVDLPEKIEGVYINYRNSRYYICDPTYIGATIGMLMPGFENKQPEIINF